MGHAIRKSGHRADRNRKWRHDGDVSMRLWNVLMKMNSDRCAMHGQVLSISRMMQEINDLKKHANGMWILDMSRKSIRDTVHALHRAMHSRMHQRAEGVRDGAAAMGAFWP